MVGKPTTNNNIKENADRLLLLDSKRRETVNTLIKANANILTAVNANDNERSEKVSWWINELDSLGIKKSGSSDEDNNKNELTSSSQQQLEDLTDDRKQDFICDYKACYSE